MCFKDLVNIIIRAYFIITTGSTISMFALCLIFKPDVRLSLFDIGGILLVSFICALTFLIFYSRRELSKKQLIIRFSIHIPIAIAILLYFAGLWNWINLGNPIQVIVFILLVLCVYVGVLAFTFYNDKKTADRLNDGLKKLYHR